MQAQQSSLCWSSGLQMQNSCKALYPREDSRFACARVCRYT